MPDDTMRRKNKSCKEQSSLGFGQKVCRALDITPDILPGGSYVEIRGRSNLLIRGCKKILKYSTDEIVIATRKDIFAVRGAALTCISYLAGAIGIEGRVDSIEFRAGKTEGK